ncbi:MAG TPA: hypothetical protein VM555_02485 [Tahibacter sp.]|nr:hypothetical protein [Tahibacter sp.]
MQRWHDYARQAIQPDFSWAEPVERAAPPRVLDLIVASTSATSAYAYVGRNSALGVNVTAGFVNGTPTRLNGDEAVLQRALPDDSLLQRNVVAPSYVQGWGSGGYWSVSALFAYQRFANATFGAGEFDAYVTPLVSSRPQEVSYGRGVRVEAGQALTERLRWITSYQSRVNMDAFSSYVGVYSDRADFDIPASAGMGLDFALTPSLSVGIDAERLMYSEIRPFTSQALPRRFLAALGSGISPEFAWDDLNVYSFSASWKEPGFGDFGLRYSSRTQPAPTSALLDQLLGDVSQYSVDLSFVRRTSDYGQFRIVASYAPTQYLLDTPSMRVLTRDALASNRMEYEMVWAMRF